MLGEEGYELVSSEDNVTIRAPRAAGLFYGVQTLRQLLPPQIESPKRVSDIAWTVPAVEFDPGGASGTTLVLGDGGKPLPVGPSEDPSRDIIVWMDHRAVAQAERINAAGHAVLKYVGGRISPEMETPKLLWLRENRPAVFDAAWQFFDLTDFLTWRASGDLARCHGRGASVCRPRRSNP